MADSRIYLKSEAGGTTVLSRDTSATSGNLVLPAGGNIASVDTAVTDNAIARYDGVTGKVQNSGVVINDKNWVNIGGYGDAYLDVLAINNGTSENIFRAGLAGVSNGLVISKDSGANMTLTYSNQTGGNTFVINSAGNVGVGVTPSAWNGYKGLDFAGSVGIGSYLTNLTLNSNAYFNGVAWVHKTTGSASQYMLSGNTHTWYTAPSGTAGTSPAWTTAMTLDTSNGLNLNTSYVGSYPAVTMFGNASNNYVQILGRNTANNDIVFNSTVGGVIKAAIYANGNFGSATSAYGGVSDIKLKENVVDASPKLDKLMQVQVRNFNFIGDDQKQIGVIAQEVEKIFPGIVYETKDTEQVEVEKEREKTLEDGTVEIEKYTETETVETGEVTKNVKYSIIYMMMLKGMQEMRAEYTAEINDLKARIEILEGAK